MVTLAFGIAAPAGSVTVPNSVAVDNWANAADERTKTRRAQQIVRETFNTVDLLEVKQSESNPDPRVDPGVNSIDSPRRLPGKTNASLRAVQWGSFGTENIRAHLARECQDILLPLRTMKEKGRRIGRTY